MYWKASLKMLAHKKISLVFIGFDIAFVFLCWYFSFALRFNFDIPNDFYQTIKLSTILVIPLQIFLLNIFGAYKIYWKYISLNDLLRIVISIILTSIIIGFISFIVSDYILIPRSVILIYPSIFILAITGSRLMQRIFLEYSSLSNRSNKIFDPLIIIGIHENLPQIIRELKKNTAWDLIGVLDNNKKNQGLKISGVSIIGSFDDLISISKKFNVKHAILVSSELTKNEYSKIANAEKLLDMVIFKIPNINNITSKNTFVSKIRPIKIEDLLGRESVKLNQIEVNKAIKSQTILVTGAAGSIGTELCQQIIKFKPKLLICLDISEYSIYTLSQAIEKENKKIPILYLVNDVKNTEDIYKILSNYLPNMVFHAAAYKHVPLMENNNVSQALLNNAIGSYTVAKACKELKIKNFVLVSTDKAVNPTNIMGASKRLAEILVQSLQENNSTKFTVVRFGNVLGSSGSVIPKFREQIDNGGPVTITHPNVTRYFMSIKEAAQLILQAATIGKSGEILILEMGNPIKILDLAKMMIHLSGFKKDEIKIKFTGLRQGEKLYEELLANNETTKKTNYKKIRIAYSVKKDQKWISNLIEWLENLSNKDELLIKKELKKWVNEYTIDMKPSAPDIKHFKKTN
jgi:FlaA1/EpsC-like NDP-sugar epimerase